MSILYALSNNVNIPQIFQYYNDRNMFDDLTEGQLRYNSWIASDETVDLYTECGACKNKCP
ncbi:MAG: hypothetical protein HZR80_00715 [Candidatus Heimdallarchaeota archaeon]